MSAPNDHPGITCNEAGRLFGALLRDELDAERRGRVKGHVLACEDCAVRLGDAIAAAGSEGRLAMGPAPPLTVPLGAVRYQGREDASAQTPGRWAAFWRSLWTPHLMVPAGAALVLALTAVSYSLWQERSRAAQYQARLQAAAARYEQTLAELAGQKEQWEKKAQDAQAALARARQVGLQPQLALSLYKAIPLTTKSGGPAAEPLRLVFTPETPSIHLDFSFFAQDYKTYRMEIRDRTGEVRWSSGEQPVVVLEKGGPVIVSLRLSADFLEVGEYELRLYGRRNGREDRIARYPLHIYFERS